MPGPIHVSRRDVQIWIAVTENVPVNKTDSDENANAIKKIGNDSVQLSMKGQYKQGGL